MGNTSHDSSDGGAICEECGAAGTQLLEVTYGDGNEETFDLCEDCLNEYRGADLIDDMSLLEGPDSQSGQ